MDLSKTIAVRPKKTIYRDGDRVIKVMNEDYSASDVLYEAFNLSVVQETGFPVQALHEVLKIDGKWALVLDYIEGKTLAELIKENPANTEAYFNRMVDIHLDMHKYKAHRLWHHTDKMQEKISQSGLDATVRYELHTRLNSLPKHNKLCHGDFMPDNVIITPDDKAYVIDWSHATQGNASADAARTFLRFMLAGNDKHAEMYLRLFCEKSDTARQYVDKWMAIVAASQLVKNKPEEREFLTRWAHVVEYD
jgi:aminoglycoside phosphotransferase (APT) family kinase protein